MSQKLRYFKVLAGNHQEGDTTYEKGKIVETTRNLTEMFGPNRFKETNSKGRVINADDDDELEDDTTDLDTAAEKPAKKKASEESNEQDPKRSDADSDAKTVEKIESTLGDDVSDKFTQEVSDNDLAVVHKGKKYFVVDRDEPNSPLNSKEELTSKAAVEEFVANFLKG